MSPPAFSLVHRLAHRHTGNRELLVTVPEDPAKDAPFYGDDGRGGRKIKGSLDPSAPNRWVVAWLAE